MNRLEKRCCDCGHTKPLEDFHVNLAMPDGRQYRCKSCRSLYDQWRRAPHSTISRLLVHWKPPLVMVNTYVQRERHYSEASAG
jgi:hypothetical protein